jgi:hypothetical protein
VQGQRSNKTLYTIADKPLSTGNFSFKCFTEPGDILFVVIKKTSTAPVAYKVSTVLQGRVLASEDDMPINVEETFTVYL